MSEGINFKDELGRLVVMVGLPYANVADAELKARMDHLDTGPGNQGTRVARITKRCACEASIKASGRAIRHVGDYACIFALRQAMGRVWERDETARAPRAAKALPEWIETNDLWCRSVITVKRTVAWHNSFARARRKQGTLAFGARRSVAFF